MKTLKAAVYLSKKVSYFSCITVAALTFFPRISFALPDNANFENTSGGEFQLAVCSSPTAHCPAIGSVITVEVWGAGGNGGEAEEADRCKNTGWQVWNKIKNTFNPILTAEATPPKTCGNSGAGGGSGGYLKFRYTIPANTENLYGNISASNQNSLGESILGATISGRKYVLAKAFAGYFGAGASMNSGGLGSHASFPDSGRTLVINRSVNALASLDGSPGSNGRSVDNCVGYPGGAGGPAVSVNGAQGSFGAGGSGGNGWNCTTSNMPTNAKVGAPGRVHISWYTPYPMGVTGSIDIAATGSYTIPICATPTATCPGPARPVTIELWGGGNGGEAGNNGQTGSPGDGGSGGSSGDYGKIVFNIPTNATAFVGELGAGGVGAPAGTTPTSAVAGLATDIGYITNTGGLWPKRFECGGSVSYGCNLKQNFGSLIAKIYGAYGAQGSTALQCSGGGGGSGGPLNNGFAAGGRGGHGGYGRLFPMCLKATTNHGQTGGENGMKGHVRLTW